MYNWKSCTLSGVEITSLRLNEDLVWEKLSAGVYTIVESKPDIENISDDFWESLPKSNDDSIITKKGSVLVVKMPDPIIPVSIYLYNELENKYDTNEYNLKSWKETGLQYIVLTDYFTGNSRLKFKY